MKGLDRGPKIELSKLKPGDIKVPGPIRDLWNELRGQRLLPVVAVLIVGLVAIPVLLGGSSKPKPVGGPTALSPEEANPSDLVVSKFAPGLRDYRVRYDHRKARDPFLALGAAAKRSSSASEGGEVAPVPSPELLESTEPSESTGGSESGASEGSEPPVEESPATEPGGESGGKSPNEESSEEGGKTAGEEMAEVTVDVRVTTIHFSGRTSDAVLHDVRQLTKIPDTRVPALTFVGTSPDGRSALMAVSSEVISLLGKATCIVKGQPCQLLALELGEPETLAFGPRGLTYRIKVERIGTKEADSRGSGKTASPKSGGTAAG